MPEKVTAIGGIFLKCQDPAATPQWYGKHLGLNTDQYGTSFEWRHISDPQKKGYSGWSTFAEDTKYFEPSQKSFMINLRVADLARLLDELRKEGIEQIGETQVFDYGKFAHIVDPEGTKIELWEANDESFGAMLGDAITK